MSQQPPPDEDVTRRAWVSVKVRRADGRTVTYKVRRTSVPTPKGTP